MENETVKATRETLNDVMDFDTVIYSHGDGETVTVRHDMYAPELHVDYDADGKDVIDLSTAGEPWELLRNRSNQYAYHGPIMHPSEFIGGRLARDILSERGYYAVLVAYPYDDSEPDGWAIAYMPSEEDR